MELRSISVEDHVEAEGRKSLIDSRSSSSSTDTIGRYSSALRDWFRSFDDSRAKRHRSDDSFDRVSSWPTALQVDLPAGGSKVVTGSAKVHTLGSFEDYQHRLNRLAIKKRLDSLWSNGSSTKSTECACRAYGPSYGYTMCHCEVCQNTESFRSNSGLYTNDKDSLLNSV